MFARIWRINGHCGSPIVLIHDSLGCVELWRTFPQILAETLNRTVIAYDRLGFGRSSTRQGLPSDDFIQEEADIYFPALKAALGLDKHVLFGYSVGGGMSLTIAAGDADCVALVSESAQAFIEAKTLVPIREARENFRDPAQLNRLKKYHGDKAQWVLDAWTELWLSPRFANWKLDPGMLARVTCPVLTIHGDRDEYGSSAFPETIARSVTGPSRMTIFDDCGHMPHREREIEVLSLVSEFLSGIG